jgi:hypothetical protein
MIGGIDNSTSHTDITQENYRKYMKNDDEENPATLKIDIMNSAKYIQIRFSITDEDEQNLKELVRLKIF